MLKHYTKEEKSWIFYDWANSAFSAIVAAIILPIFFKSMAQLGGVSDVNATAYLVAAIFYLIMNYGLTFLFNRLEKKLKF